MPAAPDIAALFSDRRGPYACDVVTRGRAGLDLIRREVPDARVSGEPVARVAERAAVRNLPRAVLLALLLACGYAIYRREVDSERRLLAALLPLATLGSLGWGIDTTSVFAVILVAASPSLGGVNASAKAKENMISFSSVVRILLVDYADGKIRIGSQPVEKFHVEHIEVDNETQSLLDKVAAHLE